MKAVFLLALLAFAFTGCSTMKTGVTGLATGAVLGGAVGQSVGITKALTGTGSSADAMTGAVLGVVVANEVSQHTRTTEERIREAYLQGQRDARVEVAAEYWNEVTYADGNHPNLKKSRTKVRQVQGDPRYIEGVKYGAYYLPE